MKREREINKIHNHPNWRSDMKNWNLNITCRQHVWPLKLFPVIQCRQHLNLLPQLLRKENDLDLQLCHSWRMDWNQASKTKHLAMKNQCVKESLLSAHSCLLGEKLHATVRFWVYAHTQKHKRELIQYTCMSLLWRNVCIII